MLPAGMLDLGEVGLIPNCLSCQPRKTFRLSETARSDSKNKSLLLLVVFTIKPVEHFREGSSSSPIRFGLSAAKVSDLQVLKAFSENSLTNSGAMATLHEGFKGGKEIPRRYLPDEVRALNSFEPAILPGVTAHILGPSRDPEVIRDLNPKAGEQWLRLMESMSSSDYEAHRPFHSDWAKTGAQYDPNHNVLSAADLKNIEKVGEGTELNIAAT